MRKKIEKGLASLDIGKILTEYFLLTIGSVILAVNFDLFLAPFNIAPGGISGSAIIIHKLKPASPTARCIYLLMEAVSRVLMDRLGVGVTGWDVKGMFSQTEHTTLFSTVNRSDVNVLKAIVSDADPKAFVVIAQGHQTKGGILRKSARMACNE